VKEVLGMSSSNAPSTPSTSPSQDSTNATATTNRTPVVTTKAVGKLEPRTLITIGVFAAIYFVIAYATGMLGLVSPIGEVAGFMLGTLINGTVIMLFLVKTRAFGAMTILGFLVGLVMMLLGEYWAVLPISIIVGLLADFIVRSGHYRSKVRNILSYPVFQLWLIGCILPIWLSLASYREHISASMGKQYADGMVSIFSSLGIVFIVLIILIGALAAWIGTRILERNLAHAGIL
jgi:energy-coupling factor transport system substrate-specific component